MEIDTIYKVLEWIDFLLFFLFLCAVGYLFIFAVYSFKNQKIIFRKTKKLHRFLIVFTTRRMDERALESAHSFLNQTYPKDHFDLAIISKDLSESDKREFQPFPVTLIKSPGKGTFRAGMLESALESMDSNYDIIVVMKCGNTVDTHFLEEINKAYYSGSMAIQTHYLLKTPCTNSGILNTISEEINNAIFRRGHVHLGFSSSLVGSGMAFNYNWFRQNISKVRKSGLTKELEVILLKQGIFIQYLEGVFTYASKTGSVSEFNRQRHNWYTSKRYTLKDSAKDFFKSLLVGNFDFCDKIIQWLMPSKFILLFLICLIAIFLLIVEWSLSIKWFLLLILLLLVFDLSIPARFRNVRSLVALVALPLLLLSTLRNTLRLRARDHESD